MARTKKTQPTQVPEHRCAECAFGIWDTNPRNTCILDGTPFLLHCQKMHKEGKQDVVFKDTPACQLFRQR